MAGQSLQVEEIIDPSKWLDCIKWCRFRRQGENKSLELFVSRPVNSQHLYAVGKVGDVFVGLNGSTIKIHENTVQVLCGESKNCCSNPKIFWVDNGEKQNICIDDY